MINSLVFHFLLCYNHSILGQNECFATISSIKMSLNKKLHKHHYISNTIRFFFFFFWLHCTACGSCTGRRVLATAPRGKSVLHNPPQSTGWQHACAISSLWNIHSHGFISLLFLTRDASPSCLIMSIPGSWLGKRPPPLRAGSFT